MKFSEYNEVEEAGNACLKDIWIQSRPASNILL